jgi:hypothetical protein
LARAQAAWPLADDVVNLVGANRRDRPYPSIADPVALLGDDVGNQQDGALVVRPRPRCDFFEICLALLVFVEQPIHCPVSGETAGADVASFTLGVPFIELSIQRAGPAAFAVLAAGNGVVRTERLIRDRAAELSVQK